MAAFFHRERRQRLHEATEVLADYQRSPSAFYGVQLA
jgi:hypothetical protein